MNDLTTLMHASVDGARPDTDRLLAGALRDGQRLQRRRRISSAAVGLAIAAIASAGAYAAGSWGDGSATELTPATGGAVDVAPSPSGLAPLRAEQSFDFGHSVTGVVVACTDLKPPGDAGPNPECVLPKQYAIESSSTIAGAGTGFAIVLTGPAQSVESFWSDGFRDAQTDDYHGLSWAVMADDALIRPIYQGQDVAIHVPGWELVGEPADDKQSIEGPHGAVAGIVWREAKDHDAWVSSSDKGAALGTWTSEVHDGVFVTISAGQGTTDADVQALGASLTWK